MQLNKEANDYKNIVECSNLYHNLIWDYIEQYGMTDKLKPLLMGKKLWIESKLEKFK